jgi:predicted methyltransferase
MKTPLIIALLSASPLLAQGAKSSTPANDEQSRRAREEYSSILHDPKRDPWQQPDAVVQSLAIKPSENILEVGADAGGYFGHRLARYAQSVVVLNPVANNLQSFKNEKPSNEETVEGPFDDVGFSSRIDTIFLYNTLSVFPSRTLYFALAGAVLSPVGRIVVIDFFKNTPPPGTPPSQKITAADVISDMKAVGFRLTSEFSYLPFQFFLVFQR